MSRADCRLQVCRSETSSIWHAAESLPRLDDSNKTEFPAACRGYPTPVLRPLPHCRLGIDSGQIDHFPLEFPNADPISIKFAIYGSFVMSEQNLNTPENNAPEQLAAAEAEPRDSMPSLQDSLRQAELLAQEHHDAWLRAKAETENVRRRASLPWRNSPPTCWRSRTVWKPRSPPTTRQPSKA